MLLQPFFFCFFLNSAPSPAMPLSLCHALYSMSTLPSTTHAPTLCIHLHHSTPLNAPCPLCPLPTHARTLCLHPHSPQGPNTINSTHALFRPRTHTPLHSKFYFSPRTHFSPILHILTLPPREKYFPQNSPVKPIQHSPPMHSHTQLNWAVYK